ncbi:MAG TPA: hypothetical protein VGC41_00810 [Kofleriaceae bacterium]
MTRRELFRRRIAPVLFGVVIALMARKSCQNEHRTHATFVLDYGAATERVQGVELDLWMNGEVVANFAHAGHGTAKFEGAFPADDGDMKLDVTLVSGEHKAISRRVHLDENATVTVNLEHDL